MYLYFDNNGILKEIVDDVATRKGNNEVNRLYIYVDGITPKTEWITYQTSDGEQSNETLIETTITKTIPYDRNRDLKYFKNFQEYLFYVATIPSSVLAVSGLTKASVRVALQDDSLMTLGLIIFTIEDSVVLQDSFITESQYQYLLNVISNFEELNNTGVIGISTQIVNGAVAPYDQGRIVLSTYNDNFTVATVVNSSTGQNVYSVLDMTFVKQVPFDNSNPNLEGLEINGKKYKVAYKTSQLNNDAGFITNAVSNLINYYDKTTVEEKLANIDLSEYYTKTESDGRYVLTTNFSWNNLANKPTSLSDFINDEGFINNTVSNLTNYYDKSSIDNIVATLKTGAFQVVSELPSSGAEGIVYLVGTEAPYTMYIWENNAFLNIGTTEVNLDGYVKGTNLNANYVILGNGGSNVVASSYTINNQNANNPNSLLTAKVINTLLGTKQDVLTQGQGINISGNEISTPVSTTSTTISQQSVNNLKYDGKPILVDYAINDDSGRIIADTYATFNDLHTLDIGDITSSSNIYQTLYQKVYENDTTKKNVVIFSTEGFVDSATSLISSGEHTATPYQDNKILIDSVFVLNSDNSATSIVSSDTVVIDLGEIENMGTLSPTILSKLNNAISENKNIVIKGKYKDEDIIYTNISYTAGNMLYATGINFYNENTGNAPTITIHLSNGQYFSNPMSFQKELISGINIKTINDLSLLGEGNIEISGSATKMTNLGTLSNSGTLDVGTLQELMTLVQNNQITQSYFRYDNIQFITANAYAYSSSMGIVAYGVSVDTLVVVNLSINPKNGNYTITPFILPSSFKTINGKLIIGDGNIAVQEPLVSGTNIKTVNGQTILGSGNVPVQEPLVSGTNIKTVNGNSLLGSGNIEISGGSSKVLEKSITDIITSQEKILTIFNAMASEPTSRTHTAILLDNPIPLSEFQNCDKIILDLSSLSSSGISGQLVFTKGFNTGSNGRAFYLVYMVGRVTSFSIVNVVLATGSDGLTLNRLVVEQSGTSTPLIDMDLANYYTKTEVDSAIEEVNNTIKIIECSPGAQLDADKLQKLQSGKYALYITGTMFYPTSDTKRFNTVPYFNYFGTSIQMCYKSVAINQANYLETISTYSIDLDIKKTTE